MTRLLNQILVSISLIATGSALKCYSCMPNITSVGKPSCTPKRVTCGNETHCLSLRSISHNSERTYKSCAGKQKCVSADAVCKKYKKEDCEAFCCGNDFCNVNVHTIGNSVSSIPVPLTTLTTSLGLVLLHTFGRT
mgnify:FL=1